MAAVIASTIREPRADVYTRAGGKELVLGYWGADDMGAADMGAAEKQPPFAAFPGARS